MLFVTTIYRMLGASTQNGATGSQLPRTLGQQLFFEPSVFSYFSPQYRIAGSGLLGPEFQIDGPAAAVARANLATSLVMGYRDKSTAFDFSPYLGAGDSATLIGLLNQNMLHGAMSSALQESLAGLLSNSAPGLPQVKDAIALVTASPEFSVQK